jgi:hypothetical protein|tara:strand:+ start:3673 stop:3936 length:264 start_codon:yes stop_codon:yes gene_type:complete
MKLFLYKFAVVLIGLFLLFEITIGSKIKNFKRDINNFTNKKSIEEFKSKIREELGKANKKDQILDIQDAQLIKTFILKIQKELNKAD